MNDKDLALFNQNVRRVIRNCALVTSPIWLTILGAFGWWLTDLSSNVGYNSKSLAKVETQVQYMYNYIQAKE